MQHFLTPLEIAGAGKRLHQSDIPHTERGVQKRAKKAGWADNQKLARKQQGAKGGGGMEYHISLLPLQMQRALRSEMGREVTVANTKEDCAVDIVKREALDTTILTARQRLVMNARSTVLLAIENVRVDGGYSRSQAVDLFITGTVDFGLGIETVSAANDRKGGSRVISRSTLLRWFRFRDGTGIGALAPKATKERADVPAWFWDFLKHYARPQKPCITEAMNAYLKDNRPNENITYTKIRRLLMKLGNVEKHRGREGSLTLKSRQAYVTRSTGDLLPTCVYTSDGKTFDAEIQHPIHGRPFRPEITAVVDVATRKCVGFSVGLAENAEGVVDALRHSCEVFGVPAIFYVDRGSGFKNKRLDAQLTGLMGRLGITKHHSLPQNSQARGIIERFHGSVWNPLAREFATYVNPEMDRQARQKSFKVTRKEQRELGASASLPSFDDFMQRCNMAIEVYNAKSHSSLPNRMSPDQYWQQHVDNGFEPVVVTKSESNDLFRPYVKRKTRRALIEYRTNEYFHIALEEFNGDYVLVGYDIHDANHVWVREIDIVDGEEEAGRLICVAKFSGNTERYVPVTMQRLADENRAKSRRKRITDKLVDVEEELQPHKFLEGQVSVPMPPLNNTPKPDFVDAEYTTSIDQTSTPVVGTVTKFGTDIELAFWIVENPDDLQEGRCEILRECLSDPSERQLFKDQGVDVERLTTIIQQYK